MTTGSPLAVQWLRLGTLIARVLGSNPGQETKIQQAVWHRQKKVMILKMISKHVRRMNEPKKYLVGEMNITLSYIGLWGMKVRELLGITTTLMI